MIPSIAPLTAADEFFNHQIVNTHAAVGSADRAWAEKAWFTLMRKDGQLQVNFGLGNYANRNILDGFAGVQHGTTQRTVRASRVLAPRFEDTTIGPLSYEVIALWCEVSGRSAEGLFWHEIAQIAKIGAIIAEGTNMYVTGRSSDPKLAYFKQNLDYYLGVMATMLDAGGF